MDDLFNALFNTVTRGDKEYLSTFLGGNAEVLKKRLGLMNRENPIDPIGMLKKSISDRFIELYNKYYQPLSFITDVPDDRYSDKKYNFKIKSIKELDCNFYILEKKQKVLGLDIERVVLKPIEYEKGEKNYEISRQIFMFGEENKYYNKEKSIIYCSKYPLYNLETIKEVIFCSIITREFCEELLLLMLYGGYINSLDGLIEMKDFLYKKTDQNINLYELIY